MMTNDTGGVCDDDEKEEREVKGPPNEVLPLSFKRLAGIAKHRKALQSIAKHCKVELLCSRLRDGKAGVMGQTNTLGGRQYMGRLEAKHGDGVQNK